MPSDSDNHHAISLHPIKMRRPNKLITELKLLLKGSPLLLFLLSANCSLDVKNPTVLRLHRYQLVLRNRLITIHYHFFIMLLVTFINFLTLAISHQVLYIHFLTSIGCNLSIMMHLAILVALNKRFHTVVRS